MRFQFHKGTIRTEQGRADAAQHILFQFHKGTIRTFKRQNYVLFHISVFQFHKGTIRTVTRCYPLDL